MARTRPSSVPTIVRFSETHEIALRMAALGPAAAVRLGARAWCDSKGPGAFAIE